MSNTTYIDLSYYDLPNINLDNINSFYTYGQELINLGVESSIVNEIYKEEKWDDIEDYNLAINKLENSNTYKKIDFLNKFKCDIDNKNIFRQGFVNSIFKKMLYLSKNKIIKEIYSLKKKI